MGDLVDDEARKRTLFSVSFSVWAVCTILAGLSILVVVFSLGLWDRSSSQEAPSNEAAWEPVEEKTTNDYIRHIVRSTPRSRRERTVNVKPGGHITGVESAGEESSGERLRHRFSPEGREEKARQAEARTARLVEAARSEPRDVDWASGAEENIEAVARDMLPQLSGNVTLAHVSCGTTRCAAELEAKTFGAADKAVGFLSGTPGMEKGHFRATYGEDGTMSIRAVLSRQGFGIEGQELASQPE